MVITGSQEDLNQLIKTNQCPTHFNPLTVGWDAKLNTHVIRCGAGHYPEEIKPIQSLTEEFKQGAELPEPVASNLAKRISRWTKLPPAVAPDLKTALLPREDLGDGHTLTPNEVQGLIAYAQEYGLDAYRGHIVIMYGKPYIGLDGYVYHANREGTPYTMPSRPLTTAERPDYLVPEGAHAWLCHLTRLDNASEFIGIGIVTTDEMTEMSKKKPGQLRSPVVAAHPWQLAQKRAEWQALRRAFPIGKED